MPSQTRTIPQTVLVMNFSHSLRAGQVLGFSCIQTSKRIFSRTNSHRFLWPETIALVQAVCVAWGIVGRTFIYFCFGDVFERFNWHATTRLPSVRGFLGLTVISVIIHMILIWEDAPSVPWGFFVAWFLMYWDVFAVRMRCVGRDRSMSESGSVCRSVTRTFVLRVVVSVDVG